MKLCSCDSQISQELIAYASKVLDALGINQGPSHMEVMYNSTIPISEGGGPCLVEVGSRCHGGEGTWLPLVIECIGYTVVSVTADVYLNGPLFDTLSPTHYPCKKFAMDCDMVSRAGGIVRSLPGEQLVRQFPSFYSISWEVHVGEYCPLTIDCFTRPGVVQLLNSDEKQLELDFENYHKLEEDNKFIDYSIICPVPPSTGTIVIVDPYASGTNLAALSLRWGFKLILIFTNNKTDDNLNKNNVSSCKTLLSQLGHQYKPTLMIQHNINNNISSSEEEIQSTMNILLKQQSSSPILAIIPGAETGVILAEQLATRIRTRCNDEKYTKIRQDKEQIQNIIKNSELKLRTIKQLICRNENDVINFFNNNDKKSVVVKTRDGTDSSTIMLCRNLEEALFTFKSIHDQESSIGNKHDGALIQEFIDGTEYIIDGVSRNNNYKIMSIWQCEKNCINGCDFVPFSIQLKTNSDGIKEIAVTEFAKTIIPLLSMYIFF